MAGQSKRKSTTKTTKTTKKSAKAAPAEQPNASGRIDKMIADLEDWRGVRLAEVRALFHEVAPQMVEDWKWMGSPVWSVEGMLAVGNAHKDKVKVKITFSHGAQLDDPKKLFNAGLGGNKWRAIDIRQGDKLDKPGFRAMLRRAITYNKTHSVPKSRGSRA